MRIPSPTSGANRRSCRLALIAALGFVLLPVMTLAVSSGEEKIRRVEGDVQAPKKIHAPQPGYPELARKERIQGRVVALVVIDKQGKVSDIDIVQSLRDDIDTAVVESLSQWEFEPATLYDEPVEVYYNLTINFRLKRDSSDSDKAG